MASAPGPPLKEISAAGPSSPCPSVPCHVEPMSPSEEAFGETLASRQNGLFTTDRYFTFAPICGASSFGKASVNLIVDHTEGGTANTTSSASCLRPSASTTVTPLFVVVI